MSKKKRSARKAAPAAPKKQRIEFVARPFAGIPREEDLVALANGLAIWVYGFAAAAFGMDAWAKQISSPKEEGS